MRLILFGIGGDYANELVGCAHDMHTLTSLIKLLRLTGAFACSAHGTVLQGQEPLSGEISLDALEALRRLMASPAA